MKRKLPLPLKIDCDGLSKKATGELVDRLNMYFFDVDLVVDTIYAANPKPEKHYQKAWDILNVYDVQVT